MNSEKKSDTCSLGRRKTATASLILRPNVEKSQENLFEVNGRDGNEYFQYNFSHIDKIQKPLRSLEIVNKYKILVSVKGGGLRGQADAIKLALARALIQLNKEKFRSFLKKEGYLSRDARIKERRKYGLKKARKASQSSKR